MNLAYCYPLKENEILNGDHLEYPLFAVTIHGSTAERIKLAKRLVCALKHLPLRLKIHYEKDALASIQKGVAKDPTLEWKGKFLAQGLVSAEELAKIFEELVKQ